ncbi:hypothetical protein QKV95_gp031 [Poseidoniales virus YSH_150918]|uniref:Uncharacterized protein n=1 Tax=Poseidoniales virus YSH_150918 TaxID=3071324 RepID=A0A976UAV5_9CAUD|nr:hypothetical protein QKV95_gp031 [Yangshan Harbor Poseidoniales virus]UVF62505.1 hypothetical protein [Poseidoniales virus YSH_150918]
MNWKDTDERTVMHMMGYAENIWNISIFREAVVEYNLHIPTLQYLVDYYIRTWGSNNDLEEIAEYLKFVENKEVYK